MILRWWMWPTYDTATGSVACGIRAKCASPVESDFTAASSSSTVLRAQDQSCQRDPSSSESLSSMMFGHQQEREADRDGERPCRLLHSGFTVGSRTLLLPWSGPSESLRRLVLCGVFVLQAVERKAWVGTAFISGGRPIREGGEGRVP